MPPGNVKENDLAVAWHGLQRMPNHPNCGGRRLLARASGTGLEVPVRLIPYRFGFLPIGPEWWVGGWGPRYLATKRERGPVRVPSR